MRKKKSGTSLAVRWLRLRAPNAGGMGSNPGQGTKTPHATRCGQKKKKKVYICVYIYIYYIYIYIHLRNSRKVYNKEMVYLTLTLCCYILKLFNLMGNCHNKILSKKIHTPNFMA